MTLWTACGNIKKDPKQFPCLQLVYYISSSMYMDPPLGTQTSVVLKDSTTLSLHWEGLPKHLTLNTATRTLPLLQCPGTCRMVPLLNYYRY
jgi:hypothetical protein